MNKSTSKQLKEGVQNALYECFKMEINLSHRKCARASERPFCLFVNIFGVDSRTFSNHFERYAEGIVELKGKVKYVSADDLSKMDKVEHAQWLAIDVDSTQNFTSCRDFMSRCLKAENCPDFIFLTKSVVMVHKFLNSISCFYPLSACITAYNFKAFERYLVDELEDMDLSEATVSKCAVSFIKGHRNIATLESELVLALISSKKPAAKPKPANQKRNTRQQKQDKNPKPEITKDGFTLAASILFDLDSKKCPLDDFYQQFCAMKKATKEEAYIYATYLHCCGFATFDSVTNPANLIINYPPVFGCPMDSPDYHLKPVNE